jgi:Domain of unknown function (DUF397)
MDTTFRKASFCAADQPSCAEVRATEDGGAQVRDTKTGNVLTFDRDEFRALTAGFKAGEFDL